jgi:hypothetical protein
MIEHPPAQASDEPMLLPCPFCGGAARIESNRDWHRLCADHDENCVFDSDDADLMYPAQDGYLKTIPEVWNRRDALKAQPAPTEAQELSMPKGSIGAQEFLKWNRSQPIPLVAIPMEMGVYHKAIEIHQALQPSGNTGELAQDYRHALQAEGKHPAPCARHCEATAFGIEIRRLEAENAQLRAVQGEDSARLDALVREAQANSVLGFAEAMVEVCIADSRIRLMAAGTAARIRVPSTVPAIPGMKEAES